jgi:hypothetical protein
MQSFELQKNSGSFHLGDKGLLHFFDPNNYSTATRIGGGTEMESGESLAIFCTASNFSFCIASEA